jgi:asparagine synthase (glutamine-hydrolysing)
MKLVWNEKRVRLETFKNRPIQRTKNNESLELKVTELGEIFSDVITRQLDADIDVGIFLSGGLDSSLIASFAAEKSKFLNAFSIELPNQNDDVSRSEVIAESLGIQHHISVFNETEFNKSLDIYTHKFDTPISDSGVLPLISLVGNAKKYTSVALAGEGGDELFAGYPWAYSSFVQTGFGERFPFFENLALRVKRRLTNSTAKEERFSNLIKANLNASLSPIDVFQHFVSKDFVLDKKEISNLGLEFTKPSFPSETPFGLQDALFWDRQHYLVNDLLVKADRGSMALGFELRLPFLSDAIIEFAGNLPTKFLISHKETKIILRRLAKARMPNLSWQGQKYGLGISDKNIASYLDLDNEVRMLLSSKVIIDAFSRAEIYLINEYFFKSFKSKWMAYMLLKWMSVRV